MKLVLATHNAHKVTELGAILGASVPGLELVGYDGPEPIEDGTSYLANALIKARAAYSHTGVTSIADDSGIAVEILGEHPESSVPVGPVVATILLIANSYWRNFPT